MIRPHELEEYLPGPRSAPRRPEGRRLIRGGERLVTLRPPAPGGTAPWGAWGGRRRQDPAPAGLDRAWPRAHHVRATTRYPAPATGSAAAGAREPAAEGHRPPGAVAHRYPGRRRTRPQSPSGTTAAPPRAAPCSPSDTGCCSTTIGRGALRQPATGSLWPKGLRGRLVLRTDLKPEYDRSRRKGAVGTPHQEL